MVEERDMAIALRRLAVLESGPLRTTDELLEWNKLRQWVIANDLVEEYKSQDYFSCADEVTKNGYAPKNPKPIFSRFWDFVLRR
jgi:hypothetical protein